MREIIEFNLDNVDSVSQTTDLYAGRIATANAMKKLAKVDSEVTVVIMAYNRLEKTKRCVESVLKYTNDVDYDLILIDNGSSDGTFEYFKTIEHEKLRIVRVTKNVGTVPPFCMMDLNWFSDYLAIVNNDLIVTENWLKNLLTVAKSDPKIGMVNPLSSNTSNCQVMNFDFSSYEEMQEIAKEFNVSDPRKWEERLRLITLGTLYTKPCLYAIGWPNFDPGFYHDFSDDDITFQIRRAGYKTILAGDTWIHHDHNIKALEDKDETEFKNSLSYGKKNFSEKYFGVDAWDDASNYIFPYLQDSIFPPCNNENIKILGIDVKSGTPLLDVKNLVRRFEVFNPETHAFFRNSKYHLDLSTICNGSVVCDRIDYLYNSFAPNYFDYIVIGENVNKYAEPARVMQDAFALLKNGGQLYFSLKNTFDFKTLLAILGYQVGFDEMPIHCSLNDFNEIMLNTVGRPVEALVNVGHQIDDNLKSDVIQLLNGIVLQNENKDFTIRKLFIDNYWLRVVK